MDKSKKYFWILLNLVLAAIFANIVFAVMPTVSRFGDSIVSPRTLTVTADAKTFTTPDIAQLSFSVVTRGQNPVQITDENNKKINAAIELIKKKGVEAKDIKTTGYNLSPDYRYDRKEETSIITGYTLTQSVSLKIRNFALISDILGSLPPLGINQIGGVSFMVDEPEQFLAEAREIAFTKARNKALNLARQNGVSLGRVISINEFGGPYPQPYYARSAEAFGKGGDAVTAPTIEPGQEQITVNVSVTYELR